MNFLNVVPALRNSLERYVGGIRVNFLALNTLHQPDSLEMSLSSGVLR